MTSTRPAANLSTATDRRAALPKLKNAGVWLVVPCYKVTSHVLAVIEKAPAFIEGIVCVDDCCPDGSGNFVLEKATDPRVVVIHLPENRGVGGATQAGYEEAIRRGGQILVKVDGDDQMDLTYVSNLVVPILLGEADYTKGNRFTSATHLKQMPALRLWGNAGLSFAAKLSSGYWNIFDPTNGFTAIEAQVAKLVLQRKVSKRYFFETDLLYHLGIIRAVVRDVPMPARYADEVSNLRISAIIGPFAMKHLRNLVRRVLGQYFVRDFHAASLELVLGMASVIFGISYGLYYVTTKTPGTTAPAGVVMTAALPIILGAQFLLQAMNFDVLNVPNRPIHPYLRAIARMEAEGDEA